MGIPLAALAVQQQPSPLRQYGEVLGIQGAQQELKGRQLANQQAQYQFGATQAMNKAYQGAVTVDENGQPKFDTDKLTKSLAGAGYGSEVPTILKHVTDFQQSQANLQKTATDTAKAQQEMRVQQSDMMGSVGAAIKAANYDPGFADTFLQHYEINNPTQKPQIDQFRAQLQQNPGMVKQLADQWIAGSPKQQEFQVQQLTAQARAKQAETSANEFQAKLNGPLNPVTLAGQEAQSRLNVESSPQAIKAAAQKSSAEAAAKLPFELAGAKAKQAITQGDPTAAAQLLVNGEATLSQLKARGVTPEFIQQTLNEAQRISGGAYNAQKAEADFKVAESPENVRFFGSAKSLTDPGGTLDQLEAAAKDIPGGKIPIFNSVQDAMEKAKGSGPLAKYAAIAVGASDDYSKVMGGGTGSDASRQQGLNLLPANASPEARHAAVEGIRGAVGSQQASRIGNNTVMQRMYGGQGNGAAPPPKASPSAHQVGDVISIKGKQMKITKMYPNGTFDAQ